MTRWLCATEATLIEFDVRKDKKNDMAHVGNMRVELRDTVDKDPICGYLSTPKDKTLSAERSATRE